MSVSWPEDSDWYPDRHEMAEQEFLREYLDWFDDEDEYPHLGDPDEYERRF
jgi:hypothetical protein